MTIRLLIVDDHQLVREGLRLLIQTHADLEVVGEAATGKEAVYLAERLRPDVVLMDLLMPGLDGVAATAAIRRQSPTTEVIMLTGVDEDHGVIEAVRAGAIGYLRKDVEFNNLCQAIRGAVAGRAQLSAQATQWLLHEVHAPESPQNLTERESSVLQLLARGLANKEIARELGIAETTVRSHVRSILAKLEVESRTQAAVVAAHMGLIPEVRFGLTAGHLAGR
jgi:NarL family two-component system response regulator LiaR